MTNFKTIRNRLVAIAVAALSATAAQAETVKITLLGVGDVYKFEGGKARGGVARLNAVARAERAANPNTLYFFDGDMLSPSLLSGFDKGTHVVWDLENNKVHFKGKTGAGSLAFSAPSAD